MVLDYRGFIEYFNLEDCILVGYFMGGFLVMKFLIDYLDM